MGSALGIKELLMATGSLSFVRKLRSSVNNVSSRTIERGA